MKYVQHFLMLLCFVLPMGLFAQASIVGDWQSKIPTEDGSSMLLKVSLKAGGTYAVDFGGDGTIEINGKYDAKDGQITIIDGSGPESCNGKGVYKYEVTDTTFKMTRVSDECEGRGGPEGVMSWTRM